MQHTRHQSSSPASLQPRGDDGRRRRAVTQCQYSNVASLRDRACHQHSLLHSSSPNHRSSEGKPEAHPTNGRWPWGRYPVSDAFDSRLAAAAAAARSLYSRQKANRKDLRPSAYRRRSRLLRRQYATLLKPLPRRLSRAAHSASDSVPVDRNMQAVLSGKDALDALLGAVRGRYSPEVDEIKSTTGLFVSKAHGGLSICSVDHRTTTSSFKRRMGCSTGVR